MCSREALKLMGDKLNDKAESLVYIRLFYHSLVFASMPTPTTKNSSQILSMIKESVRWVLSDVVMSHIVFWPTHILSDIQCCSAIFCLTSLTMYVDRQG